MLTLSMGAARAIPDLEIAQFPAYAAGQGRRTDRRNAIRTTTVLARPRFAGDGDAGWTSSRLGRFVAAGTPLVSVVAKARPGSTAQTEGDRTSLSEKLARPGDARTSTLPDHRSAAKVRVGGAPAPGGPKFANPSRPQNASGNG